MYKGYKIRIYPTKEQQKRIWEHINVCRFIWNYMLNIQIEAYNNENKHLSTFDMTKMLPNLKKNNEYTWLNNVSGASLKVVCANLQQAYTEFFAKRAGFPKFKTKKSQRQSYPVRGERLYFDEKYATIEKIGKVKYRTDFSLPNGRKYKYYNPYIYYKNGIFMLSFSMECENQTLPFSTDPMGIDLGMKELATVAHGDNKYVFHNVNKSHKIRKLEKEISHISHKISRKYNQNYKKNKNYDKTKNIIKEENKLRKKWAKILGIRTNNIHQTTHRLISMNPCKITMETIDIKAMAKNKIIRKNIYKQGFYMFIRQMRYKCNQHGIEFVQVPLFYPSSKTCSCCGNIKAELQMCDRIYVCKKCGLIIDRDYNAAINLMKYKA